MFSPWISIVELFFLVQKQLSKKSFQITTILKISIVCTVQQDGSVTAADASA